MKCIVTAGPTYEEVDQVRRLTNFSTGTLGTELANFLTERGHAVVLLRGYYSTCAIPIHASECQTFTTTADLRDRLHRLSGQDYGAIFHAAAVSDFAIRKIWNRGASGELEEIRSPKVSTRAGTLFAELEPTPKILPLLRSWYPNAFVAGWKYELEGTQSDALRRAAQQIAACRTNVCVLNGAAYGTGFALVSPSSPPRHLADRARLFEALQSFL